MSGVESLKGVDLAVLAKPVLFDVPTLGAVRVDARRRPFQDWFRNGERDGRWAEPRSFVKAMLLEQASAPDREGQPFEAAVLEDLGDDQLDEAARAFVDAAEGLLSLRRVREGAEQWEAHLAAAEGESQSARLLRLLRAREDERAATERKMLAEVKRIVEGPFGGVRMGTAERAIEETRRSVLGSWPGDKSAGILAADRGTTRFFEEVRRQSERAARYTALAIGGGLGSSLSSGLASEAFKASATADREILKQARSVVEQLALGTAFGSAGSLAGGRRRTGLFAEIQKQAERSARYAEMDLGAGLGLRHSGGLISEALKASSVADREILKQQRMIAGQMQQRESAIGRAIESLTSSLGRPIGSAPMASRTLAASGEAWARKVSRRFEPGLEHGLLGSVAALEKGISEASAVRAAAGLSPGFGSVANLGLQGAAAGGAVADVLKFYGEPPEHADLFAGIVFGVGLADLEDASPEAFAAAIRESFERGTRKFGRSEWFSPAVIVALVSLLVAVYAAWIAQQGVDLQRQALAAPPDSASSADIDRVVDAVKALREDEERVRRDSRQNLAEIRYLHKPAALRVEGSVEAPMVRIVYPDQSVRVLETKGGWARVEVFDYSSDSTLSGWINRRSLRQNPL